MSTRVKLVNSIHILKTFSKICYKFKNSTEQVPNADLPRKPQPTNSSPSSPGEKGDDENNVVL